VFAGVRITNTHLESVIPTVLVLALWPYRYRLQEQNIVVSFLGDRLIAVK